MWTFGPSKPHSDIPEVVGRSLIKASGNDLSSSVAADIPADDTVEWRLVSRSWGPTTALSADALIAAGAACQDDSDPAAVAAFYYKPGVPLSQQVAGPARTHIPNGPNLPRPEVAAGFGALVLGLLSAFGRRRRLRASRS